MEFSQDFNYGAKGIMSLLMRAFMYIKTISFIIQDKLFLTHFLALSYNIWWI